MKKTYIKPATIQVALKGRPLMAGSTKDVGGSKGVYSGSGQLSRQSMWDDDEE